MASFFEEQASMIMDDDGRSGQPQQQQQQQQQPQQHHQQQEQQQGQQQQAALPDYTAMSGVQMTTVNLISAPISGSADNASMMGMGAASFGNMFSPNRTSQGDISGQLYSPHQAQAHRMSFPDGSNQALGVESGMSMLDFGVGGGDGSNMNNENSGVEDAFQSFSFGPSSMGARAPGHPFPPLTPEMMSNMMAFPSLSLDQMAAVQQASLQAESLGFFSPVDTMPDASFVSAMDMGINSGVGLMDTTDPRNLSMSMPSQQEMLPEQQYLDTYAAATLRHSPSTESAQQATMSAALAAPFPPSLHTAAASMAHQPLPMSLPASSGTSGASSSTATATVAGPPISASTPEAGAGASLAGPDPTPVPSPSRPSTSNALAAKPKANYYSSSGFDMVRALYYVSSRPNPEIAIGPVDFSCAFVVCDATLDDYPIIYVSDTFQHLTGYSSYEILGQNCRFLQAPDGKVEAGAHREFTDNKAVHHIKQKLLAGREVQQSLINYRKGGKPFLNLLTMIPIPWDDYDGGYRYFIGLQIDLVESPDAISGQTRNAMSIDYKHSSVPQYIWEPPKTGQWGTGPDRTLSMDDVSALLQQFTSKGLGSGGSASASSDLYRQSWDKMLLENVDDVVHVLSLKGVFLYVSPSCKAVLEYESDDLLGSPLSSICHPSDIVPVTREMRDTHAGQPINFVFRIRRKESSYTWFESFGSLLVEQGKGRKCIVLVGRKRPVFALSRYDMDTNGGVGDSELWTKLSTSGLILHVSSNSRSLLDQQPDVLMGTSMQDLMRKESRAGFNRTLEKVRRGIIATCRHEVQHRRGQVLQASTILYPGDAQKGQKPTFVLGQTRLLKPSSSRHSSSHSHALAAQQHGQPHGSGGGPFAKYESPPIGNAGALGQVADPDSQAGGYLSSAGGGAVPAGSQDAALAADDNLFDELKTTRCTSWQYELRQAEKSNRALAEELGQLLANRKKRKRRKGVGNVPRDCANCHTRNTPEWRRGPSGQRDLCNSCGLRWAKQVGRVSPRNSSRGGGGSTTVADVRSKKSTSPVRSLAASASAAATAVRASVKREREATAGTTTMSASGSGGSGGSKKAPPAGT